MPQVRRISDGQALELMRALRLAVEAIEGWRAGGGQPGTEVISAAAEFAQCLSSISPRQEAGRGTCGRKRIFDRAWATGLLIETAIRDPDGLPASQQILVNRLRNIFKMRGGRVPKDTWLKAVVGDFFKSVRANDAATLKKFRETPDLQSLFKSENDYLISIRARDRAAEKWLNDKALQQRFSSIDDYIAFAMGGRQT